MTIVKVVRNRGGIVVSGGGGGPVGNEIATIALTAGVSGSQPVFFGQEFKEGDVASGQSVISDSSGVSVRVYPLARWPSDNSLRHAAVFGAVTFAGVSKSLAFKTGSPGGGANLTAADIQSVAPTASQQCGAIGTVNLSSLLASPFRTRFSTPEMVECHYRSAVGSDASLVAWFHVRMYAGFRVWIRAFVENGYLNGSPAARTYVWTVNIGGVTVHNASRVHDRFARMDVTAWIGTDPQVTPSHHVQYLDDSKMVPHYGWKSPSATKLNSLQSTYTPMDVSPLRTNTTGTGGDDTIGPHPGFDALYFTSGDPRSFVAMEVAARAVNAYGLVRRSSASNRHAKISDFPTTTFSGGSETVSNDNTVWDVAHAPHVGYGAYLATADYYHYESMMFAALAWYFCRNSSGGSGTSRNIRGMQNRAIAWGLNIIGHCAAIAPTEGVDSADLAIVTDVKTWLGNAITNFMNSIDVAGQNKLGVPYMFSVDHQWTEPNNGGVATWMTNFWVGVLGRLADIKPLTDMTNLYRLRNFMYRWTIGTLGPTGADNYYFAYASNYGVVVDPTATGTEFGPDTTEFYDSWGDVFTATQGRVNAETTNALQGDLSGTPANAANGYWGNLRPGIIGAVDHGAPGALAAYRRMTGASNYSVIQNAGFDDNPIWGFEQRPISSYISTMTVGTWYAVSGNSPDLGLAATTSGTRYADDIDPDPGGVAAYKGSTGFAAIMDTWNSGIYTPALGVLGSMLYFGGGHRDYYGNVVIRFDLYTRQWSRFKDPSTAGPFSSGASLSNGAYTDGTPSPAHYYGYLEYDPISESLVCLKSITNINSPDTGSSSEARPWMLSLRTGTWRRGPLTNLINSPSGGHACYDIRRQVFWSMEFDQGDFASFDTARDNGDGTFGVWTVTDASGNYQIYSMIAHDPDNDALIILDAAGSVWKKDPDNMAAARVAVSTSGATVSIDGQSAFNWSPVLGGFVYHRSDTGSLYLLSTSNNWSTGVWTSLTGNVNGKTFTVPNGFFNKSRTVEIGTNVVQVIATRTNAPVLMMRLV